MYGQEIDALHTATCLLDTGAGVNCIIASLKHTSKKFPITHRSMSQLRTTSRQPMEINGIMFFYSRVRKLLSHKWFVILSQVGVSNLPGTFIINHIIHGIFQGELKAVPKQMLPFAILTRNQQQMKSLKTGSLLR